MYNAVLFFFNRLIFLRFKYTEFNKLIYFIKYHKTGAPWHPFAPTVCRFFKICIQYLMHTDFTNFVPTSCPLVMWM